MVVLLLLLLAVLEVLSNAKLQARWKDYVGDVGTSGNSRQADESSSAEPSKKDSKDDAALIDFGMPSRKETEETLGKLSSHNTECPQHPCGISLVFMGDSLSRFQYYSLVYFLRHGTWIDPNSSPNLVRPMDFLGGYELNFEWSPWFNASMAALAPYENCDCYREAGRLNGKGGKLRFMCENRYYYDPVRNNRVTFIQSVGSATTIRGHWDAQKAWPQLERYHRLHNESAIGVTVGPMQSRVPYLWEGSWMDAIRGHVSDLKPDVLVMNAGKWAHSFAEPDFRGDIMSALNDTSIPRVIWRTTTADRGGRYRTALTDHVMCQLVECMNATWTVSVPRDLYVDQGHFTEPVYRLLNEQMLTQLNVRIPASASSISSDGMIQWYSSIPIPGLGLRIQEQRDENNQHID